MPFWTDAICFSAAATTATVLLVSGLAVTASIARIVSAAAASVRAVWRSTSTLVSPASTATRGKAVQAQR